MKYWGEVSLHKPNPQGYDPAFRGYWHMLAWSSGWKPKDLLAMLYWYFDESGDHGSDGRLKRLTLAGAVGTCDQWNALSLEWNAILEEHNLPLFHMVDFEHWRPPFRFLLDDGSRDYEKHRRILNQVLDCIIKHLDFLRGFICEPESGKSDRAFDDAYETNIAKVGKELFWDTGEDRLPATVYCAKHPDFKARRIAEFIELWDEGRSRLHFGGVGEPLGVPPFQVADIVAYELSRRARDQRPEQDRYPFRRLNDGLRLKGEHSRFLFNIFP